MLDLLETKIVCVTDFFTGEEEAILSVESPVMTGSTAGMASECVCVCVCVCIVTVAGPLALASKELETQTILE